MEVEEILEMDSFVFESILAVLIFARGPLSEEEITEIIHELDLADLSPDPDYFDALVEETVDSFIMETDNSAPYDIQYFISTHKVLLVPHTDKLNELKRCVDKKIWNYIQNALSKNNLPELLADPLQGLKLFEERLKKCKSEHEIEKALIGGLVDSNFNIVIIAIKTILEYPTSKPIQKLLKILDDQELSQIILEEIYILEKPELVVKIIDFSTAEDLDLEEQCVQVLNYLASPHSLDSAPLQLEILRCLHEDKLSGVDGLKFNENSLLGSVNNILDKSDELSYHALDELKKFCIISDVTIQTLAFNFLEDKWAKQDLSILESTDCEYDVLAPEEYRLKELVRLDWPGSAKLAESCLTHPRLAVRDEAIRSLGKLGDSVKIEKIRKDAQNVIDAGKHVQKFSMDAIAEAIAICKEKNK